MSLRPLTILTRLNAVFTEMQPRLEHFQFYVSIALLPLFFLLRALPLALEHILRGGFKEALAAFSLLTLLVLGALVLLGRRGQPDYLLQFSIRTQATYPGVHWALTYGLVPLATYLNPGLGLLLFSVAWAAVLALVAPAHLFRKSSEPDAS